MSLASHQALAPRMARYDGGAILQRSSLPARGVRTSLAAVTPAHIVS